MKVFATLILLFSSIYSSANTQSGLTLVAVGEAELETEKLVVREPYLNGSFTVDELAQIKEFTEVFRNDFSFYKKLYSVQIPGKNPLTTFESLNFSELKQKGVRILMRVLASKSNQGLEYSFEAWKSEDASLIVEKKGILSGDIREIAHSISNDVFKKLNGKESIFNSKITFVSDVYSSAAQGSKTTELFIMDFDGRNVKKLTNHRGVVLSPAFSKDGQQIIYSLIQSNVSKSRNVALRLYDLNTKSDTLLSNKGGINSGAVFTPDGESIILTLSHVGNAEIFEMNLKTRKLRRITRSYSPDVDPSISVDGSLMTFLSGRPGKPMIYTMDPSGIEKNVKRISYIGRFNATPRFSPDGKEIAFSSWLDQRFDIFRINSDGTGLSRLTKDFGSNEDPTYSNDGEFIAFSSQRVISSKKADQNIYIMDREGEIIGPVTKNFGNCITPRWSK
ncbi:hypothetical protein HBN50_12330 [Halobacteriovorax sp. GB3]|uniref:TolB family protein n=1 Tax=Halobacteriovorax sp. GB3 TaxID=2719615 RepID=UPI00235FF7BB|nr:hypothetical protein [Halobacteriovorax sp. GB3]MDD0853890.1 hypothetical protein [Halobacteriovorax sp. GB3]